MTITIALPLANAILRLNLENEQMLLKRDRFDFFNWKLICHAPISADIRFFYSDVSFFAIVKQLQRRVMGTTCVKVVALFFVSYCTASSIIEQDLFGDFTLEKGTLPFCWRKVFTYHDEQDFTKFHFAFFGQEIMNTDERYSSCQKPLDEFSLEDPYAYEGSYSVDVIRVPASTKQFGPYASFFDNVAITRTLLECTVIKYDYSKPIIGNSNIAASSTESDSMSSQEPVSENKFGTPFSSDDSSSIEYKYKNIKFSAVLPLSPVTLNGISLTPKKRYLLIENNSGHCVYSAPPLKRLPIQDTYNLIRSPLLKPPPSFCKSKLQIIGTPGVLDASQLLFDNHTNPCLKGIISMVQEHNMKLPAVTKLVHDAIPYFDLPLTPFKCGNSTIYLGVTQILRDISIKNVISLKAGKYFGMIDEPMPYFNLTQLLSKVTVCLYSTTAM